MPDIEGCNLFMCCKTLNKNALSEIPEGFTVRPCRKEELDIWYGFPFDHEPEKYRDYMQQYFKDVYQPREAEFFRKCLFLCDHNDTPVGTCFAWKAYGSVTTIHWYKIRKEYEGHGLGRALLSAVMKDIPAEDYPVYLHTQPGSYRAIKLYTDFGFALLTDRQVGFRENELSIGLPYLREKMPETDFARLRFETAPEDFLQAVKSSPISQF